MVITKIEKQKKNSKRWNLYVDGEFACGISEDTLLNFGLRTNDDITQVSLDELKRFDEYQYAKKAALDFLSYRVRSKKEIRDKLKEKKISKGTIDKTLAHLEKLGLLNDEDFARLLVQSKTGKNPAGKNVIKQKLFQKGITKEISEKVLDELYTEQNEKKLLQDVFKKYSPKLKGPDDRRKRKKIFDYLARKGFDFELINELLNEKFKE